MNKKFNSFHHIDQSTIDKMFEQYKPVFILSTGRSGSKYIHTILQSCENLATYHEAFPTLQYFSNFAYHNQGNGLILEKMFLAARMELLLEAYNKNESYVESNQCLAFYAYSISKLFKKSKFVHLVRHPADFLRSAIMKGWHSNDSIWESGRVRLCDEKLWNKCDQIEKLAWVWRLTNDYIKSFLNTVDNDRWILLRLEDISNEPQYITKLLKFVDCKSDLSNEDLFYLQNKKVNEHKIQPDEPPNMKKLSVYPKYESWNLKKKNSVRAILGSLASFYHYNI